MSRMVSNIIKAANIGAVAGQLQNQPSQAMNTNRAHTGQDTATIELHKNGDVIEAIEVTCSCGQTTVIECVYEDQEQAP